MKPLLSDIIIIFAFLFSCIALITSIRANSSSRKLSTSVVELQKSVIHLQTEIIVLQKDITSSLNNIDVHFKYIEKYAQSEYYKIYGNVGQISSESREQGNKSKSK